MAAKDRAINIVVGLYNQSQFVDVVKGCKGYMFTNIGDTIAEVNGMVIFPSATPATVLGDSRSIGGDQNEEYKGLLRLVFRAPIGATPLVEIVQIFYTDAEL